MEFIRIVDDLSTSADESELSDIVSHAVNHELTDHDIAHLADKLANSGTRFKNLPNNGLDIASTGGPSSLSTLLTPLFLRLMNRVVPKLGIPGRPAGGVDVLATIANYRVHLQPSEVVGCLKKCGYVHFVVDKDYAPLDARFFAVRQRLGAEASVPLVIASLLAKKLVVGLKEVGLDIRVGPDNNFGISFCQAGLNARRFCSVARILGIKATCILTDGSRPYQPMIGRGESLVALNQLFEENAEPWLQKHMVQCWNMATELTGHSGETLPSGVEIRSIFASNLSAQGSSLDAFHNRISEIVGHPRFSLLAKSSGWVLVKLGIIRAILVEIQRKYPDHEGGFSDPIGVQLLVNTGGYVEEDEKVVIVRAPEHLRENLESRLSSAMEIVSHPIPALQEGSWEVISDAE
jgi:pyrimidine-nucleoside phosphorylase